MRFDSWERVCEPIQKMLVAPIARTGICKPPFQVTLTLLETKNGFMSSVTFEEIPCYDLTRPEEESAGEHVEQRASLRPSP